MAEKNYQTERNHQAKENYQTENAHQAEKTGGEETVYQIYDKTFKKILTLSTKAVVNLINGLFGADYPTDSTLHYNWTEFEDDRLKKILADTIVTVNGGCSYHMEAQMTEDEDIVFRVFEYGFAHADRTRVHEGDSYILNFPEPKIIYLSGRGKLPPKYTLKLRFGSQGEFPYSVDTFLFNEISVEELNRKKMIILIPFKLLKLQKSLEKERTPENLEALQYLIRHDIIEVMEENLRLGNITVDDARRLRDLTKNLYRYLYAKYEEAKAVTEMTDESMMLEYDLIEKAHEEEIARIVEEKEKQLGEKNVEIEVLRKELEGMRQKKALAEKDIEIKNLKGMIKELNEKINRLQR